MTRNDIAGNAKKDGRAGMEAAVIQRHTRQEMDHKIVKQKDMTPNPTKEEVDALEREVQKQRKERERRVRHAVNPRY